MVIIVEGNVIVTAIASRLVLRVIFLARYYWLIIMATPPLALLQMLRFFFENIEVM